MLKIYGCSDDLVELEGDINDEFYMPTNDSAYLGLSNGTLLSIVYDADGLWRIRVLATSEDTQVGDIKIIPAPPNDDDQYSDVAIVDGTITWVAFGNECAKQ
jgi:hypothetical protein